MVTDPQDTAELIRLKQLLRSASDVCTNGDDADREHVIPDYLGDALRIVDRLLRGGPLHDPPTAA